MTENLRELIARALHDRDEKIAAVIAKRHPNARLSSWDDSPDIAKDSWREEADAALAAIECTHAVVPLEPTIEMCDAATLSTSAFMALEQRGADLRRLKHAIRWRAMLASRPRA